MNKIWIKIKTTIEVTQGVVMAIFWGFLTQGRAILIFLMRFSNIVRNILTLFRNSVDFSVLSIKKLRREKVSARLPAHLW